MAVLQVGLLGEQIGTRIPYLVLGLGPSHGMSSVTSSRCERETGSEVERKSNPQMLDIIKTSRAPEQYEELTGASNVSLCVRVCISTCVCVSMSEKVHVCEVHRSMLLSSSVRLLAYFTLRQSLSLNLGLIDLARLAGQQGPGILLSLLPQCWNYRLILQYCLAFFVDSEDGA